MNAAAADQMSETNKANLLFRLNTASLRPIYQTQDMFLATYKPPESDPFVNPSARNASLLLNRNFDLLGGIASGGAGLIAAAKLPGGRDYSRGLTDPQYDPMAGKYVFMQQLWLHVGNIFRPEVLVHPSDYSKTLSAMAFVKGLVGQYGEEWEEIADRAEEIYGRKITTTTVLSSPRWDYKLEKNDYGKESIYISMISKQIETGAQWPIHWTIEKYSNTFQGEDFFVTVIKGDKRLDKGLQKGSEETVRTYWPDDRYQYLVYDPDGMSDTVLDEFTDTTDIGEWRYEWIEGISNEAFYIHPPPDETEEERVERLKQMKNEFWWDFKSYVMVEIGAGDPHHNYFIELVRGRHPRFLHLGEEWDHPDRYSMSAEELDHLKWGWIKKCRVLSVYKSITADELLRRDEFRIGVQNHLGKIVITFEGNEGDPWVVDRFDNYPGKDEVRRLRTACVVPCGKIRIHGGNISCSVNFSVTTYPSQAIIPFDNRQVDAYKLEDDDVYLTFSHIGRSEKHVTTGHPDVRRRYFNDPRIGPPESIKIGFDCDAYGVLEYHKNREQRFELYTHFPQQYKMAGKGWVSPSRSAWDRHPETREPVPPRDLQSNIKRWHQLSVLNIDATRRPFSKDMSNYRFDVITDEEEDKMAIWNVGIALHAGAVYWPMPQEFLDRIVGLELLGLGFVVGRPFVDNCVSPICTGWRMMVLGGEHVFEDQANELRMDISPLVVSIKDGWTADGLTSVDHEATVRCYIPWGEVHSVDEQPVMALANKLYELQDKHFYVTIKYWWENGVGRSDVGMEGAPNEPPLLKRGTRDPFLSDELIQMTGIATKCTFEKSVNKLFMNITVKDYAYILEKQFIFNSPFFDGVDDVTAVYELARLAGLYDEPDPLSRDDRIDRRPLNLLQNIMRNRPVSGDLTDTVTHNGELVKCTKYNLPGSYANIADPKWRFNNGQTFWESMKRLSSVATKCLYFDRWGVLHFETIPAIDAAFTNRDPNSYKPKYNFRSTTLDLATADVIPGDEGMTIAPFPFDPGYHIAAQVFNVITWSRSVEDSINQLVLMTASNEIALADGREVGGYIIEGHTFYPQILDVTQEGFVGFRKPFYQSNGLFGEKESIRRTLTHYAKMKFPPTMTSFECYGIPGLKALDVITLDDNLFYITEISHEVNPEENRWWMNISGEWLKPFKGVICFLDGTCVESSPDDEEA
jgi:hypothetical protein